MKSKSSYKQEESFDGSEIIEELIEIEDSIDGESVKDANSGTVATNIAAGCRGSIVGSGSVMEDNNSIQNSNNQIELKDRNPTSNKAQVFSIGRKL